MDRTFLVLVTLTYNNKMENDTTKEKMTNEVKRSFSIRGSAQNCDRSKQKQSTVLSLWEMFLEELNRAGLMIPYKDFRFLLFMTVLICSALTLNPNKEWFLAIMTSLTLIIVGKYKIYSKRETR